MSARRVVLLFALGLGWITTVSAIDGGGSMVLDLAAGRLGINRQVPLDSLEYQASGRYFQFGQAPAPELPWPEFTVDGYVATLDFARGAVHARYHRVQVQEPGRARPHSEQTQDQYARDGVTWNLAPGPVAIPSNLAERNAELWASPQGFVKAAIAHRATVKARDDGTMRVSFMLGKYRYEGELNRLHEVTRVSTWMESPVLGDTPIEFRYSEYRDFDGLWFPTRIERSVAGLPWYELTVSDARINTAQPFDVPAEIAANPVPTMARIEVSELAPGLWLFGGGSHNSVIVEQARGLLVIEAPLGEERSQAILAEIRRRFAGRKIIGVINTHTHFDHAGGLRTFVAEGIPVITHERNADYFAKAWKQPRTLDPDRLAKSPRRAVFRTFTDRLLLDDAQRPVELHAISGSGHNDAFAMAYLPRQRILVEADAWTPTPAGAKPPPVVNPLWINLYDNVQRLKLDVARVAPLHGAVQDFGTLREAIRPR
jgi:glyoxylase-like metal-dependent hydrolase (beta-lactamase superfamily II)